MGFLNKLFSKEAAKTENRIPENDAKKQKHKVAGVAQYESNLLKLAKKNPAYSFTKKEIVAKKLCCEYLYEYTFAPQKTALIPDSTNPNNPNAIKVVIDGQHVGYIKPGSCARILKLINEGRIAGIQSKINGGNYQIFVGDGVDMYEGGKAYEKGKTDYKIEITIFEK